MANLFENKDRRVVPNWRSFQKTVALGELNVYRNQLPNKQKLILSIDSYIKDWTFYRTSIYAGELLSAAKVNGFETDPNVIEAAEFLIKNPKNVSRSQQLLAKAIIEPKKSKHSQYQLDSIHFDKFQQHVKPEFIWDKIHFYKRYTKIYPYNAIFWVELSRYYSILGLKNKALNAMKVAIHLAPENRFILRSASRLFAHYDDIEYAHDLLRKSRLVRYDPWFTSAEIALATIRNRTSRFIKMGMEIINSKSFSPFSITELSSSIGTVELLNGSIKKSRYFFNKSLIEPNDNSLAQIEWASEKDHQLDIDQSSYEVINSFEAQALANYHDEKYNEALDNTYRWFMDMPFSKRPVMFGSYVASIFKDDHLSSRNFQRPVCIAILMILKF